MSRILLVDGDVLVYKFAHSEQKVTRWEPDLYTTHAFLEPAKIKMALFIDDLLEDTGSDEAIVVLSDPDQNYRKELFDDYKSNRGMQMRPLLYKPLREFLMVEYGAHWETRLEGDDLLGLHATAPADDDEFVMATIDKDLNTVPGLHYNWDAAEPEVVYVSPEEAERFFYSQVLMGDNTDGYKGCPGVGPVGAKKILDAADPANPWPAIVAAYQKKKLSEDVALMNARCAWILRGDDYDFETKEVRLWTPREEQA